jgi:hypothetical protein
LAVLFACKQAPTVRIGTDCKISWLQAAPRYSVIPAQAGIQHFIATPLWISACAEMTEIKLGFADLPPIIRRLQ